MKFKSTMILALCLLSVSFSSCYISRVDIGSREYVSGKKDYKVFTTYSQIKKEYLFWGLLPLNPHLQPAIPTDSNYTIQTYCDAFDVILPVFTYGIFGMQTVKVLVKPKEIQVLPPNK